MRPVWLVTTIAGGCICALMIVFFLQDNEVYISPPVTIDQEESAEAMNSSAAAGSETEDVSDGTFYDEEGSTANSLYELYAPFTPLHFKEVTLKASIADTVLERQQGLSGTPAIPSDVAKLFIFETDDRWGFWMKDMNYSIDMIWLDSNYQVVHIVHRASPDSYPSLFTPPVAARYVVETEEGFAQRYNISIGETVTIDWQN